MTVLLVALGAGAGAAVRFAVAARLDRHPGTLLVNLIGSFLLGLLVGADVGGETLALLGTGLCGGLTTYSAFAVQAHEVGRRSLAWSTAYVVVTVAGCLGACAAGWALGTS